MSVSVNRHLRAAATVLALLGMLVLSTGVALMVAAPANASSAKHKGGDCGGDDDRTVVSQDRGGDDGCGDGCWSGDRTTVSKHKGDCDGGCDEQQPLLEQRVSGQDGDDCDPCPPTVTKHKNGDWDECEDPCPPTVSKHKNGDWDECEDPCQVIIIGKKSTVAPVDECIAPDPEVTFTDPSCANEGTASWNGSGDHSTFELVDGTVGPGEEVTVDAHTVFPYEYSNHETSMEFNHTFGPAVTPADCTPPTVAVPTDPSFTDPTCDTDGSVVVPNDPPVARKASGPVILVSDAGGVHYVVSGSLAAGETAYVDATALPGFVIEEGAQTHWEHTFAVPADCPVVSPPVVSPPVVDPVVAPTVVHAGLVGAVPSVDPRTQQGRILAALGLALLVLAGGLGLRPSSANRR